MSGEFKAQGIVTLTTDFGTSDGYVGAMKGRILAIAPALRIIDNAHHLPRVARHCCLLRNTDQRERRALGVVQQPAPGDFAAGIDGGGSTPGDSIGGAGAVGGLRASGPTDNTRATPGDVGDVVVSPLSLSHNRSMGMHRPSSRSARPLDA